MELPRLDKTCDHMDGLSMMVDNVTNLQDLNQPRTDLIFHYTSLGGLEGISKTGYLFASAARYLNDAAEVQHFSRLLKAEAQRRKGAVLDESLKRFYSQMEIWIDQRMVGAWGLVPFVACFSKNEDQLSQWRGYCPPGKGINIGFSMEDMQAAAESQGFTLGPCLYELEEQKKVAVDVLDDVQGHISEFLEETNPSKRHPSQSFHGLFERVYASLIRIACFMKDRSFHEEAEWRLVSTPQAGPWDESIQFREGSSMLIPYLRFELPKGEDGKLLVRSAKIGPTPHPDLSSLSLGMLSASRWSKVMRVHSLSSVPYRTW